MAIDYVVPNGDGWEPVKHNNDRGHDGLDADPDPIVPIPDITVQDTRTRLTQTLPTTAA